MNNQQKELLHKEAQLISEGVEAIKEEVNNINDIANAIIDQLFSFKMETYQEELSGLIVSKDYFVYKKFNKILSELPWWEKMFKWQRKRIKDKIRKEIDELCDPFINHVKQEIQDLNYNYHIREKTEDKDNRTD